MFASVVLLAAVVIGIAVGPAGLSPQQIVDALAARLPWHPHVSVTPLNSAILWQIRLPRVVLGVLVGSILQISNATDVNLSKNTWIGQDDKDRKVGPLIETVGGPAEKAFAKV